MLSEEVESDLELLEVLLSLPQEGLAPLSPFTVWLPIKNPA